jgi:alkylation response protein AidB-like acyl-CoA dehydrogenase
VSASQLLSHPSADGEAGPVDGAAQASSFAPQKPAVAAHVIRDDAEAIRIAHRVAENFAGEASIRDRERRLPLKELDEFSQSGLWGINVPRAYGGAEVSYVTVAEVIKIVSAADPSIGQIPQNHLAVLDIIRLGAGLPPEKRHENELESVTERRRTHAGESIQRRADHRDIARA